MSTNNNIQEGLLVSLSPSTDLYIFPSEYFLAHKTAMHS